MAYLDQSWVQYGLPPSKLGLPAADARRPPDARPQLAGGAGASLLPSHHEQLHAAVYHGQHAMRAAYPMSHSDFLSAGADGAVLVRQNSSVPAVKQEPQLCPECWMQNGRHSKKCPSLYLSETPEQREKRLKKEERLRDQELGAEYVDAETQAERTFIDYAPSRLRDLSSLCKAHPDPVTETSALNSIMPPPITCKIKIPKSVIERGLLTDLQLESILYACDQHQRMLPCDKSKAETPVRAGFFMGDGPGVGKGRQIAGIIMENYLRDRKKAVWISVGPDLLEDARRDLRDIGAGSILVHDLKNWNASKKLSAVKSCETGVLFSTYTLLASNMEKEMCGDADSGSAEQKSRLKQIVEWCGPEFDGVIAFDEAHKAKNMVMKDLTRGRGAKSKSKKQAAGEPDLDPEALFEEVAVQEQMHGTKSAQAVLRLQKLLPNARVVYVSATGASEPEHLLYASRLGLWGAGTCFRDSLEFAKEIKAGGPSAMELLCMQMKQSGKYLARSLSFKGSSFEVVDVPLTKDFEDMYDASVSLWRDVINSFERGFKQHPQDKSDEGKAVKKAIGGARGQIWGSHQRFFGQMLMAAKVEETVRITQEAIEGGKCVVIGIQNTGEAGLADDASVDGCSAADHILRRLLRHHSNVDGREFISAEKLEELLEQLDALQLPMNPLDDLIDKLGGPRRVAEMTGRAIRQVCEQGEWVLEKRIKGKDSGDALNIQERKKFMSGKKLVAIISDAASTGISLQADRRVKNDRRRVHITLQLPWSADKAVQQVKQMRIESSVKTKLSNLTGTVRTDGAFAQVQSIVGARIQAHDDSNVGPPKVLDLGGEWRFASAVAERLQQLGAITQGDRRATGGSGLTAFAIDSEYGLEAVKEFEQSIKLKRPWRGVDVQFLDPNVATEEIDRQGEKKFKEFAIETVDAFKDAGLKLGDGKIKMTTFLNRLLGLKLRLQTQVFSYWHILMEELIRDAKKTGRFQEGILDIGSELVLEKESVLFEDALEGTRTCMNKLIGDRGVSWEQANKLMMDQSDRSSGVYRSKKNKTDVYNIFLALEKKQIVKNRSQTTFVTVEPHSGFRPNEIVQKDIRKDYEMLSGAEAEKKWRHVYELSKDKCSCDICDDPSCELKKRSRAYHVLTGSVLPFWNTIKSYVLSQEQHLDVEDRTSIKVVRVETRDKRRLVGILIQNENAAKIQEKILEHARKIVADATSCGTILDQDDAPMQDQDAEPKGLESSAQANNAEASEKNLAQVASAAISSPVPQDLSEVDSSDGGDDEEAEDLLVIDESEENGSDADLELVAEDDAGPCGKDAVGAWHGQVGATCDGATLPRGNVQATSAQDAGDETEDESDNDVVSGPVHVPEKSDAAAAASDSGDRHSGGRQRCDGHDAGAPLQNAVTCERPCLSGDLGPDAGQQYVDIDARARDSMLSNCDTPDKIICAEGGKRKGTDFGVDLCGSEKELETEGCKPATVSSASEPCSTDAGTSCRGSTPGEAERPARAGVRAGATKARIPAPELLDSHDEEGAGDEKVAHEAEAKRALNGEYTADSKKDELTASGLWEDDDFAEDFFTKGLEIIQIERRKDESARRRYVPPKRSRGGMQRHKSTGTLSSRTGRVRKQTDHFAKGSMKGQRYVNGDGETEDDVADATETESDCDDTVDAGEKARRGKAKRDGATREKVRKPRAPKKRQDASAVMIDRVLRSDADAKKIRWDQSAKDKLKQMASNFLGGLLGRPELSGTMSERAVKLAIRTWIPGLDGVGEWMSDTQNGTQAARGLCVQHSAALKMGQRIKLDDTRASQSLDDTRGSDTPAFSLTVPRQPLKRQIKQLHPSCSSGELKGLSKKGILRIEAILAFFCQALVQQVSGIGITSGLATISDTSLSSSTECGIENLKDGTLRKLLNLEPLPASLSEIIVLSQNKAVASLAQEEQEDSGAAQHKQGLAAVTKKQASSTPRDCDDSEPWNDDVEIGAHSVRDAQGASAKAADCGAETIREAAGEAHLAENGCAHSRQASDDEQTESETDLDDDEQDEAQAHAGDADVTEDDDADGMELDEAEDQDGHEEEALAADDFLHRSHYCSSRCKFGNQYCSWLFMLCCEACDGWFHGKCLGIKEGTIAEDQVWVCSQTCLEDLPLAQRKKDIVVGTPKRAYKKRQLKEKVQDGDKKKGRVAKPHEQVNEEEEEEEQEEEVEWTEDYKPRFQTACEQPPKAVDRSLVGRTIMCPFSSPHSGWFPAKVKKQVMKRNGKKQQESSHTSGMFVLTYTRKATKGLLDGEYETRLDLSEYGKGIKGRWVLLEERVVPVPEPGALYCKKSCTYGRQNGDDYYMILCEACEVWFHGGCVGVEDGDVKEDEVWVCCQKCKYDLPRNLRGEALVGNSFKKQREVGSACTAKAKISKHLLSSQRPALAYGEDDDDDDVPILERAAALAARSSPSSKRQTVPDQVLTASDKSKDLQEVPTSGENALMKIIHPLSSFVGKSRMPKREALSAVLFHIRTNELFDPKDGEYVLADDKLKTLTGGRPRVKLRKLAKRVAKYIIEIEDGDVEAAQAGPDLGLPAIPYPQPRSASSPSDWPGVPSSAQTSSDGKNMLLTAAPTPTTLQEPCLLDATRTASSPETTEANLKKRLGFSEADSSSPFPQCFRVPSRPLVSSESCTQSECGQGDAWVTSDVGDVEVQPSKRRRLVVDDANSQEGEEQACLERGAVKHEGGGQVGDALDSERKRKASLSETEVQDEIPEDIHTCKKQCGGIGSGAADVKVAVVADASSRKEATSMQGSDDDVDDDLDLDLEALEAQALANHVRVTCSPSPDIETSRAALPDGLARKDSAGYLGGDAEDDDLDGLTLDELAQIEQQAMTAT